MTTQSVPRTPRPPHRGGGRAWHRVLAGALALITALGVSAVFAPSASAALSSAGPIDPASLFPSYYADSNGLQLQMCQDGLPNCLAGPEQIQDVHAAGGDAEAFYFHASNDVAGFTLEAALEAAYLADGPDQEMTFMRSQATGKNMTPNGKYTFTDPYGTYTCTADATGLVQPAKGCRFETGAIPGNFNAALSGRLGPFLTWDTFGSTGAGAPPAGFIGDNATPHAVVGSPTGFNKMRVSGPGIVGTCTNDDGSTVANCQETDKIIIQGKVQPGGSSAALSAGTLDFGDIAATPPVTKTLTYANTGSLPVTISSVGVTGTGAAAFAVQNNCPVAPATVDVGTRCTIGVTFTPDPGKSSAATLTVNDDTAAATRNVALKGSNLGVMYVADPVPTAGIVFPTTGVGSTSLEDNAVIGNSGNGPLTISSATITGASAAMYKLGPNNTCKTPVAPDGGCEIGVQFVPTSTGSKSANLRVTDSNGKIVNVPLTGTGGTQQVPGAPTGVTATAGNAAATVKWIAPTSTGTSAITGYSVRVFSGTTLVKTVPVGNVLTTDVTELTNGTAYTFDVAATNVSGTGTPSAASAAVTPQAAAPGAPTIGAPAAGNASATVRWTAPTSNGGSPITGYEVRTYAGTTGTAVLFRTPAGATATSVVVPGLTNGTSYTFRVVAINAVGTSVESARSTAVTPGAPVVNAAPTVTAKAPGTNAFSVPVANNITATFSEAVTGVNTTSFAIRPAATPTAAPIAGTVTKSTTVANQWILNPTASLAADTKYTVTLTGGTATATIHDTGTPAAALATTSWSFTTGPAPTVTAKTPASAATGVSRTANITATFSENVQAVSGTTVTLKNATTGAAITAVVSYNATTHVVTLNPSATLAASTKFTATLTGGAAAIRDAASNPLTTTTWSFTTGTV